MERIWSEENETKLRSHVSKLKAQRSSVEGTTIMLESLHMENPPATTRHGSVSQDVRKLDLETAVLMQVRFFLCVFVFTWFEVSTSIDHVTSNQETKNF